MKFLVTGGSGFIGRSLISRLTRDGHQVYSIGRSKQAFDDKNASFLKADITDLKSLQACKKALPKIDRIIHLAALVPKTPAEDQAATMFMANVQGTVNLLEVFGESVEGVVYASTAEVYGLPDSSDLIDEAQQQPRPLSYYGASKLAGELFCQVYGRKHGLAVSILRFTVLYGPGDRINRAIPNFIKQALAGNDLDVFGGEELRDYLHVNDAVEALYLAATTNPDGIFNIGTGQGQSIAATAAAIIQAVNPDLKVNILPRQKKAADIVLNVDRAKSDLGFQPRHRFPDLLDEQVKWHRLH